MKSIRGTVANLKFIRCRGRSLKGNLGSRKLMDKFLSLLRKALAQIHLVSHYSYFVGQA